MKIAAVVIFTLFKDTERGQRAKQLLGDSVELWVRPEIFAIRTKNPRKEKLSFGPEALHPRIQVDDGLQISTNTISDVQRTALS